MKKHLFWGECDCVQLANDYGTPLYVVDQKQVEDICHAFTSCIERYKNSKVIYASKALCNTAILQIINKCGLAVDAVSSGEIATALNAGISPCDIYLHGNNKTISELEYAISNNVGTIVVDCYEEVSIINEIAKRQCKTVDVLVRINPGVEAHTHHYIQTAKVDSKFGFGISDGCAENVIKHITSHSNIKFIGLHCHIGSQIFDLASYKVAVDKMCQFISVLNTKYNIEVSTLNMGGGIGIWYTDEDVRINAEIIKNYIDILIDSLNDNIYNLKINAPKLLIEPGRSIVGQAGITLYTVGSIKEIPNVKTYVSVDGGIFENPRYALYQAKHSAVIAGDCLAIPSKTVTVAGKCCESSDVIIGEVTLPNVEAGDILAVFSTGAYNYSMASNYNRNAVPEMILVKDGTSRTIVAKQTISDILRNDVKLEKI